ncbi:MAG: DUF11 domain-containing protein [Anaerolineae bacterium]
MVQVAAGETAVYALTLRNRGAAPASGIVLTDVLPSGLVPLWAEPTHPDCVRQGSNVSCDTGDLRDGDVITFTLDLSVGGTQKPVTSTQLAGVSWITSAPACAVVRGSSESYVTCRLGRLEPGAETTARLGVNVDAGVIGALAHVASVTSNEPDTDLLDNRAAFTVTVGPRRPALSELGVESPAPATTDLVLKVEGPDRVVAGQLFTTTYNIMNRGTLDATGVRFEYTLPPATVLDSWAPGLPLCQQQDDLLSCSLRDPVSGETVTFELVISGHSGQPMIIEPDPLMPGWPICTVLKERPYLHILTCELGALKPEQAIHVELSLVATGVSERMMTSTASVSAEAGDLNPLDNTNTTTTAVQISADVLVRAALSGPAVAGEQFSYTLTTVNLGPSDADVVLTDTVPVGTRFVSATPSRGDDCQAKRKEPTAETIVCNLGRLRGGEAVSVEVVAAVDESLADQEIAHSAKVVAEQVDPDLANNDVMQLIPVSTGVDD